MEQTELTNVDVELKELLKLNEKLQAKENEDDGIKADYVLLAKSGTKALQRSQTDLYIPGLQIGDIFIQKSKTNLGATIKVVPLAFITLYQERENTSKDAQFFGVWNKEQATSFPLVEGNYFNRQLPNGHILIPVNWVMVNIIGHHEIENAVIAFKSTGSRIWRKWKEDCKEKSQTSATLIYKIFEKAYANENYDWTDFGFEYVGNLVETDKNEALYCLKKSNSLRESYEKATLIANHNLSSVDTPKLDLQRSDDVTDDEDIPF